MASSWDEVRGQVNVLPANRPSAAGSGNHAIRSSSSSAANVLSPNPLPGTDASSHWLPVAAPPPCDPVAVEADDWTPFRGAVAEWTLGRRPIEDMPAAALTALERGLNTPSLAHLAAMEHASWSEIVPVLQRVVAELGGPPSEHDARLLVADAWLARVADDTLDPAAYDDYSVTEEVLWHLGGDYDWFRRAIYDLELLEAMDDHRGLERALVEMRARAAQVLRRPVAERLAAAAPTSDERPFLQLTPARRRRPRFLRRGTRHE
jgi:hypothetical protein